MKVEPIVQNTSPILTKRQLDALISNLYREVSRKQITLCDEAKEHNIKEGLFQQYNDIRSLIQQAGQKLRMAGGLD
jgi:hypothetical protein